MRIRMRGIEFVKKWLEYLRFPAWGDGSLISFLRFLKIIKMVLRYANQLIINKLLTINN